MQNHRLIPYKFKSNMHLFYQEKIRWFKTKEFFLTEERFLSHRRSSFCSVRKTNKGKLRPFFFYFITNIEKATNNKMPVSNHISVYTTSEKEEKHYNLIDKHLL